MVNMTEPLFTLSAVFDPRQIPAYCHCFPLKVYIRPFESKHLAAPQAGMDDKYNQIGMGQYRPAVLFFKFAVSSSLQTSSSSSTRIFLGGLKSPFFSITTLFTGFLAISSSV